MGDESGHARVGSARARLRRFSSHARRSAALGALAAALLAQATLAQATAARGASWDEGYFPNAPLLTHEGESVRFYDDLIRDRIVVINFVYTDCPDVCALSTARLAEVQRRLGERVGRELFFYSISLDPERDTPEVLARYARALGVGPGWLFLTGDGERVAEVRYKLGERSRSLTEHRADVVLGNARTGEWERTSSLQDLGRLENAILAMDPAWRERPAAPAAPSAALRRAGETFASTPGQALFAKACAACHTIGGGDLVGPDLAGLGERRAEGWLRRFLRSPDALRRAGDRLALALAERYPDVPMPNLSLSDDDVDDLLVYIEARSRVGGDDAHARLGHGGHGGHAAHGHDDHGRAVRER